MKIKLYRISQRNGNKEEKNENKEIHNNTAHHAWPDGSSSSADGLLM